MHNNNLNVVPNAELAPPVIFPPRVSLSDLDRGIIIRIPPYKGMAAGDSLTVDYGAGELNTISVKEEDIGKYIQIFVSDIGALKSMFSASGNLNIAYQIDGNPEYEYNNNLSVSSAVSVIEKFNGYTDPIDIKSIFTNKPDCGDFKSGIDIKNIVPLNNMYVPIPNYKGIAIGDIVTVYIQSPEIGYFAFKKVDITSNISGEFGLLMDSAHAILMRGKNVEIWYDVTKANGDYLVSSVSKYVVPVIAFAKRVLVEEVPGEDYFPNGRLSNIVSFRIPSYTTMKSGDLIKFNFKNHNAQSPDLNTTSSVILSDDDVGKDVVVTNVLMTDLLKGGVDRKWVGISYEITQSNGLMFYSEINWKMFYFA